MRMNKWYRDHGIIYRAREGECQCPTPKDGWIFARFDDGDQWQCSACSRVWTRYENYAGGGWS